MTTPNQPLAWPQPAAPQPPSIHPVVIDPALVPERRGTIAFMASIRFDGDWTLPQLFRAIAFMGAVEVKIVDPNSPSRLAKWWSRMLGG